ncbi:MAG: hypothetical protein ABI323_01180 [Solirubrobacteraceae bacterium]
MQEKIVHEAVGVGALGRVAALAHRRAESSKHPHRQSGGDQAVRERRGLDPQWKADPADVILSTTGPGVLHRRLWGIRRRGKARGLGHAPAILGAGGRCSIPVYVFGTAMEHPARIAIDHISPRR